VIIWISEAKDSHKNNLECKQINGKFNDVSSADKNK
jgi:hypothetical protein